MRGSSSVQMAVVSVNPYAWSTGIPSIRKNSCVSGASGAEPQIRGRRFGRKTREQENPGGREIEWRVVEDAVRAAGTGTLAHELIEALGGALQHVVEIANR